MWGCHCCQNSDWTVWELLRFFDDRQEKSVRSKKITHSWFSFPLLLFLLCQLHPRLWRARHADRHAPFAWAETHAALEGPAADDGEGLRVNLSSSRTSWIWPWVCDSGPRNSGSIFSFIFLLLPVDQDRNIAIMCWLMKETWQSCDVELEATVTSVQRQDGHFKASKSEASKLSCRHRTISFPRV